MTSSRRRSASGGFSLIELLVVIAVIALLISIILPALGSARKSGQKAKCLAHMKQYMTAHHNYISDHGVMPGLGLEGGGNHNGWVTEVGLFDSDAAPVGAGMAKLMSGFFDQYVRDARVFSCPADPLVRYSPVGGDNQRRGRFGNMLTPDEDGAAVGATFTRVWFNPGIDGRPADYIEKVGRAYVTVDGLMESHELRYLRPDRLTTPALCADIVEESEDSHLDNSVFVLEDSAWSDYPPLPGTSNLLANRHPADSGNIGFHDGHAENISGVTQKYWAEPVFEERLRLVWRNF